MVKLFIEQISVIDSTVISEDFGIIGESWIVDVELEGKVNNQGMLFDFALVKKRVKELLDERVDHKLIAPKSAKFLSYEVNKKEVSLEARFPFGSISVKAPEESFCFIDSGFIDESSIVLYSEDILRENLPENIDSVKLILRREQADFKVCRYSHGLKKHDGNCQRIVHGHRSPIKIFLDKRRNKFFEAKWAKKLDSIYIVNQDDIIREHNMEEIEYLDIGYESSQGRFDISIPKSKCYIIDSDPTVENIASHIYDRINERCNEIVGVILNEGVGKGAIIGEVE